MFTKILVAQSYYESWNYVPILIVATTYSCLVNFLASVYMAEKKSFMALLTALSGAVSNVVLNFIFIPKMGANGAALATVCAFVVVFITRSMNTRKYVRMNFQMPTIIVETAILVAQSMLMLKMKTGIVLYAVEFLLLGFMLWANIRQVKELFELIFSKFLKRKREKM